MQRKVKYKTTVSGNMWGDNSLHSYKRAVCWCPGCEAGTDQVEHDYFGLVKPQVGWNFLEIKYFSFTWSMKPWPLIVIRSILCSLREHWHQRFSFLDYMTILWVIENIKSVQVLHHSYTGYAKGTLLRYELRNLLFWLGWPSVCQKHGQGLAGGCWTELSQLGARVLELVAFSSENAEVLERQEGNKDFQAPSWWPNLSDLGMLNSKAVLQRGQTANVATLQNTWAMHERRGEVPWEPRAGAVLDTVWRILFVLQD